MRVPSLLLASALAALAAGCGEKCHTQSPDVQAMATSCTAVEGQQVSYPLKVCPACNLSNVTCTDVQISAGSILLNPTAEACEDPSSCSASCAFNDTVCTFTAPAAGDYTVMVYNPATGQPMSQPLKVLQSGTSACTL